jgi:uncharacterized protein (DUF3084 family)
VLVRQKEATIEQLQTRIVQLEKDLVRTERETPDALARQLDHRVRVLSAEFDRLAKDRDASEEQVRQKEEQLREARGQADDLAKQVAEAYALLGEYLCPTCGAPLLVRGYVVEIELDDEDAKVDVPHEYVKYECGLSLVDDEERDACGATQEGDA